MRLMRATLLSFSVCFLALPALATDTGGPIVTPEPTMVVLLAAGLTGIGVAAWRRNRKQ